MSKVVAFLVFLTYLLGSCAGVKYPAVTPKHTIHAKVIHFGTISSVLPDLPFYFRRATAGYIDVQVSYEGIVPFPAESATHNYSSIKNKYPHIKEDDIRPVWYYEHDPAILYQDLYLAVKEIQADIVFITTEAQFEGVGKFTSIGKQPVLIVESISVGGWARGGLYNSEPNTDAHMIDVIIHELGHYMGLKHACSTCIDNPRMEECCNSCTYEDDTMSYCRTRPDTDLNDINEFSTCNVNNILTNYLPRVVNNKAPTPSKSCN